jgi:phytoene desaturase
LFDTNFDTHAAEIYKNPRWPSDPALYVSVTSKTDPSVAPEGQENLMVLIPVATGLDDTEEMREHYFEVVMKRLENISGQKIREHVVYKRSYAHNDFISDYHAYKGNAYGLANTLMQTAFLKPKMKSSKLKNLYFSGQLTVPGPGVPPAIMSGRIAAEEIMKLYLSAETRACGLDGRMQYCSDIVMEFGVVLDFRFAGWIFLEFGTLVPFLGTLDFGSFGLI